MKTKEIRAMSVEEMDAKLVESKDKLFKQKMQKMLGQSDNPNKISQTRKDIAKLMTIISEKKRSPDGKTSKG